MKHLVNFLKNRIWFIAAAVLLVLLTAQGCAGLRQNAVALEQSARCGMTEHVHTGDCYMDELLVCGKSAHSHGENCYIFRVSDNDLNAILTDMGEKDIRSLEDYIAYNLAAVYGEGQDVDEYLQYASVEELNAKLSTTGAKALRLNAAADLPAVYAIGGTPSTTTRAINFYATIDGKITFINSSTLTDDNRDYISYENTVSKYRAELVTALSTSNINSTYYFRYNTDGDVSDDSYFDSSAEYRDNNIRFGNTNSARYAIMCTRSGNRPNYTYTPVQFYTVTLDYSEADSSKEADVQYVQSGVASTLSLSDEYLWVDDEGNAVTAMPATITETTTLFARPKNHSVTLVIDGSTYDTISDIKTGDTISEPAPKRTGYTLDGWYTDAGCTQKYNFNNAVTSSFTLYAKWTANTYTVTYKDSNGNKIKDSETVAYGGSVTLPAGYVWEANGKTYAGGASVTIYGNTDFVGTPAYTVSFNSNGGTAIASQSVISGGKATDPGAPGQRTGYSFDGWYLGDTLYNFSTSITGDITLTARWTPLDYTLVLIGEDKLETTSTISFGEPIVLPTLSEGYNWMNGTVPYSGGSTVSNYDGLVIDHDNRTITFEATNKYTVTYDFKDDTKDYSESVYPGTVITLPAASSTGNVWLVEGGDGTRYYAGDTYTINENTTFVESSTLTVSYDVNFTTSGSGANRYTTMDSYTLYLKEDAPTIVGDSSAVVAEGETVNANSVSNMNIVVGSSSNAIRFSVIHFKGWLAEDGSTLIAPGTIMDYETLARYDSDNDGTVTLTADWYYKKAQSADFFIIYNSRNNVEDANSVTDAAYYTGVAFSTYVGGVESDPTDSNNNYRINYDDFPADDKPSTYELDSLVRGLHGEKNEGAWLAEFPSDEAMFEYLRSNYPDNMSIEGTPIDADDLTTDKYTIRWYKFQYVGNDGNYHIDGVLVKKEGQIYVDKVFGGIEDAVNKAKEGFYILAENGYKDANGDFIAYDENDSAYNTHVLVLDEATKTALQTQYPNATFQTYNTQDINSDGEIDKWLITGVELGEYWRFTEYAVHPTNADGKKYSWYAEYSVTDTDGEQSAIAEFGSIAQVIGKTYALDEDPDQGLSIKFTNYYYANDSILVRKIDSGTGTPLGNAVFELWQPTTKGGESVKLRFNDDGNGVYTLSETGDKDTITTNAEGFSVITITGFSFEAGPLTVKEVSPPSGYDLVNPVTVHYLNGESGDVGVTDIVNIDPARYAEFAEYYVDERTQGGVIVVKDHTAYEASVTVNKIWENPNYIADSVTVVLQATVNGVTQNAGALFPNLTGHQVVLDANGGYPLTGGTAVYQSTTPWTYTWTGLPAYANGELVSWGIKEIKVGNDSTLSDGVSFASWVPSYSPASYWDSDGNGIVDSWSVSVTNSQKRPMVNIYKTDASGARVLEGATFTLEKVQWNNGQWEQVPGTLTLSQTSDANGWLIFDNLTPSSAGSTAFYRLTEASPPPGYTKAAESVVFTVDGLGNIYGAADGAAGSSLLDTEYVDFYSRYYLTVRNEAMPKFPETGGDGNDIYAHLGALLMLAAAAAVIYKTKGRKEDDASVV